MPAQYIGNNDYRGYLNYLGSTGDQTAKQLLGYVGNDAKFGNTSKLSPGQLPPLEVRNIELYNAFKGQQNQPAADPNAQLQAVLKQIAAASGGGAQVYAPKLDIAAINSQARSAAENAVNPYYTKTLNDFLAQQSAQKQQQQTQFQTNVQNLQDQLKQTQEANALTGTRTTEDVAAKQGLINESNNQNQIDTGTQFEDARLAQAKAQAASGVLGTGAGNRATGVATAGRNTQEGRQNVQFQQQRDQQELFKSRTFEDLAKSNELAKTSEAKGVKAAQFDLDSYIQNAGFTEQNQRNQLEQERLGRVGQEQQNQGRLLVNNFINSIANPAQRQAAVQAYSGAF